MSTATIIVRTKLFTELKGLEHSGLWHGRFCLVTAAQVRNEIARRLSINPSLVWR